MAVVHIYGCVFVEGGRGEKDHGVVSLSWYRYPSISFFIACFQMSRSCVIAGFPVGIDCCVCVICSFQMSVN